MLCDFGERGCDTCNQHWVVATIETLVTSSGRSPNQVGAESEINQSKDPPPPIRLSRYGLIFSLSAHSLNRCWYSPETINALTISASWKLPLKVFSLSN